MGNHHSVETVALMEHDRSETPSSPTISVVIPAYNSSHYLGDAIESVLDQTFTDFEIVVVDDGSDLDLAPLVAPYGDRVRLLRQSNTGPAAARNRGIRASGGRYVALLDHDDLFGPDKLQRQVALLERNPDCGMVYGYHDIIDADGKIIPHRAPEDFPAGDVHVAFLIRNRVTSFGETLIRRSVFDTIGYLDESPRVGNCDDYDFWLRLTAAYPILHSPRRDFRYRLHEANLSRELNQHLPAHLYVYERAWQNVPARYDLAPQTCRQIRREHFFNLYRRYALRYYYDAHDYRRAAPLFLRALAQQPTRWGNLGYAARCLVPDGMRSAARRVKKKLAATG